MSEPRDVIREARTAAGLSVRALATKAGISPTTITRIEAGRVDPTWSTIRRVLGAAGRDASLTSRPLAPTRPARGFIVPKAELADLTNAWQRTPTGDSPDWTLFRGTLDLLALHPDRVPSAIRRRPAPSGSTVIDALLAGIAEKLADDAGLSRPAWTRKVPGLTDEWAGSGTPAMIAARREATPHQLRDREIVVEAASLWRDRTPIGAWIFSPCGSSEPR